MAGTIHRESGERNIVTIEELCSPDVLYPYYMDGSFKGLPNGLSPSGFYELISKAATFMRFYLAYYNGEIVCVFECRPIPGVQFETHANWLTDSKRKRAMALDKLVSEKRRLVTFVRPDEADGHFAFTRRGKMHYLGELNNMHVFRSWQ